MTLDSNLINAVQKAAKALHANEKFPVPVLAVRAGKAAQENPHDVALVTASNVLKKMASDNRMFITRAELNDIYEKLYSPSTKLADVFAEELGRTQLPGPKMMQRSDESHTLENDYSRVADPLLSNALDSAFRGEGAKLYTNADAVKAEKICSAELMSLGFSPKKVDVFAGKDNFIVCQATYETPKGQSHVLVPIEMKDGMALIPSLFLTQAGFVNLGSAALETHIKSTAGKSFKVDGQKLLDVLVTAANGVETIDEVELAAMRVNANKETPAEYTPNGIIYQQIENVIKNPEEPKTEDHFRFAERLASANGMAQHVHGDRVVRAGIDMIARKLGDFGFKHSQVSVASVEPGSITYAVAVDSSAGFKVPVKVENGMVLPPSIAIASGQVSEFSQKGLSKLTGETEIDKRALVQASPVYGMKPSELMEQVRAGIAEGNIEKAEDAIDVLGEVDQEAQKRALALLLESFNPSTLKKIASEQKGCSMIVKNSSSKHEICGHLNIPTHKVYQDKNGDCQPLYRKGMEETNEGGTFLAYKIFQ
jgi:hypothetical protein